MNNEQYMVFFYKGTYIYRNSWCESSADKYRGGDDASGKMGAHLAFNLRKINKNGK